MSIQSRRGELEATQQTVKFFETLLRASIDGIVITDTTQTIVIANEAFCSFFGARLRNVVETNLFVWLEQFDDDAPQQWADLEKRVRLEGACRDREFRLTMKNGYRHLNVNASLLERVADEERGVIISIWCDITERKMAEEKIKASLKEKEILLREIHHRVKNNMQLIISLLRLQADKIEEKKYADLFKEGEDRIRSMSLIHEKLYQTKDFANIDFGAHVKSIVDGLFVSHGVDTNKIRINMKTEDISFDLENAIPCGLIINELVSNSLKYAFPQEREGEISIALRPFNEDEFELTVSDDGIGISEALDIEQTDTMGLTLVKVLTEHQLGGQIEINRSEGTQFSIKFKRAEYKPRI